MQAYLPLNEVLTNLTKVAVYSFCYYTQDVEHNTVVYPNKDKYEIAKYVDNDEIEVLEDVKLDDCIEHIKSLFAVHDDLLVSWE